MHGVDGDYEHGGAGDEEGAQAEVLDRVAKDEGDDRQLALYLL